MVVRRLLIALAVLIALTAVAAGVNPRPEPGSGDQVSAPASRGTGKAPLEVTLPARPSDRVIVAESGREVRITVTGDVLGSIELGDLEVAPIDPESPAIFDLLADEPGSFPIMILDEGTRIGTLEVRD